MNIDVIDSIEFESLSETRSVTAERNEKRDSRAKSATAERNEKRGSRAKRQNRREDRRLGG